MTDTCPIPPPRSTLILYGMSWHARQSDAFREILITPLQAWINVSFVAWDGHNPPSLPPPDAPVCFAQLPPPLFNREWRHRPLTWIPMWDYVATNCPNASWWKTLPPEWGIVALSEAVARLARERPDGRLFVTKYHHDPNEVTAVDWSAPRTLYYWNRVGLLGPRLLKTICQSLEIERLLYRDALDPNIPAARGYALPPRIGNTRVENLPFTNDKTRYMETTSKAQFVVAPRPHEGVGMVMLDALARGAGVLAADAPTASEYIQSGRNGVLLAHDDTPLIHNHASAWAHPSKGFLLPDTIDISTVAQHDWPRMGEEARQNATVTSRAWNCTLPDLATFLTDTTPPPHSLKGRTLHHAPPDRQPLVSICLPVSNKVPVTQERIDSIRAQTWQNWECLLVDSGSDAESISLLQSVTRNDSRFRVHSTSSDSIAPDIPQAISLAQGDFLYIATTNSDLDPSGIETMALGLARHPDCGACHTPLAVIKAGGVQSLPTSRWNPLEQILPAWAASPHIRQHPFDALFSAVYTPPYLSTAQLLFRRSAIEQSGAFRTCADTTCDFSWAMRLGATCDILYLPTPTAAVHKSETQFTAAVYQQLHEIAQETARLYHDRHPRFADAFNDPLIRRHYRSLAFVQRVNEAPLYWRRAWTLASESARFPAPLLTPRAFSMESGLCFRYRMADTATAYLARHNLESCIRLADDPASGNASQTL